MKKNIILLSLMSISLFCNGQNISSFSNCKDVEFSLSPDDEKIPTFDYDNVNRKVNIIDDPNSPGEVIRIYLGKPFNGRLVRLNPDCTLFQEVYFEKGKRHLTDTKYSSGQKISSQDVYYYGDLVNSKTYYTNGSIYSIINYKNNLRHGPYLTYQGWGFIETEKYYVDGKMNGPYKTYYSNGELKVEGNYKNDNKKGLFKYYNKDGTLNYTETY